jgi:hypothetical protein
MKTPETDEIFDYIDKTVSVKFARKLELERNRARNTVKLLTVGIVFYLIGFALDMRYWWVEKIVHYVKGLL